MCRVYSIHFDFTVLSYQLISVSDLLTQNVLFILVGKLTVVRIENTEWQHKDQVTELRKFTLISKFHTSSLIIHSDKKKTDSLFSKKCFVYNLHIQKRWRHRTEIISCVTSTRVSNAFVLCLAQKDQTSVQFLIREKLSTNKSKSIFIISTQQQKPVKLDFFPRFRILIKLRNFTWNFTYNDSPLIFHDDPHRSHVNIDPSLSSRIKWDEFIRH